MKLGILSFGYEGFNFQGELKSKGFFTTNLGDNIQTVAVKRLLLDLGYPRNQIVPVNRDTITAYKGEAVALIMNGCFWDVHFPLAPQIVPIFIGFQTNRRTIQRNHAFFAKHQPIGCRDEQTCGAFKKQGIEAYVTGCLTMTLPRRETEPKNGKPFVVYGKGAGRLPMSVFHYMPAALLEVAELFYNRNPVNYFPFTPRQIHRFDLYSEAIFTMLCERASLIVTPLHHIAAPAMAAGIPVIVCREKMNSRFTFIKQFVPVYTPKTFDTINWDPSAAPVHHVKEFMRLTVKDAVDEALR